MVRPPCSQRYSHSRQIRGAGPIPRMVNPSTVKQTIPGAPATSAFSLALHFVAPVCAQRCDVARSMAGDLVSHGGAPFAGIVFGRYRSVLCHRSICSGVREPASAYGPFGNFCSDQRSGGPTAGTREIGGSRDRAFGQRACIATIQKEAAPGRTWPLGSMSGVLQKQESIFVFLALFQTKALDRGILAPPERYSLTKGYRIQLEDQSIHQAMIHE